MKYQSEYRKKEDIQQLAAQIRKISKKEIRLMEVCGGHTMAIQKFGIPSLLPPNIKLLSGPGCPVCVTSRKFIDQIMAYSRMKEAIITTFGDLIRVPGSSGTLDEEKAAGADIRMVYSILEAIDIAVQNPGKQVIFAGIGFETTAPGTAAGILQAAQKKIKNFTVLSSHKIMPPAMAALIDDGVPIDGYIAPGHVSTITGSHIYEPLATDYKKAVVVSGFEPLDLLQSVYMLVNQIESGKPAVEIQYKRVVTEAGNQKAQEIMNEVFTLRADWWRGLGVLEKSGLGINKEFSDFDTNFRFPMDIPETSDPKGCRCGEILRGTLTPTDCSLFAKACTPVNPVGSCMVSSEGACQAYYRYRNN
ncbi:MAG TPA: hydrogenase formation protein HypD [Bacteroidales bacterium]|nr:hydrogenase formation protein HypD [Bacteroidales bacterium]